MNDIGRKHIRDPYAFKAETAQSIVCAAKFYGQLKYTYFDYSNGALKCFWKRNAGEPQTTLKSQTKLERAIFH